MTFIFAEDGTVVFEALDHMRYYSTSNASMRVPDSYAAWMEQPEEYRRIWLERAWRESKWPIPVDHQ